MADETNVRNAVYIETPPENPRDVYIDAIRQYQRALTIFIAKVYPEEGNNRIEEFNTQCIAPYEVSDLDFDRLQEWHHQMFLFAHTTIVKDLLKDTPSEEEVYLAKEGMTFLDGEEENPASLQARVRLTCEKYRSAQQQGADSIDQQARVLEGAASTSDLVRSI